MRSLPIALAVLAAAAAGCSTATTVEPAAGTRGDASTSDAASDTNPYTGHDAHIGAQPVSHRRAPVDCSHTRGPGTARRRADGIGSTSA